MVHHLSQHRYRAERRAGAGEEAADFARAQDALVLLDLEVGQIAEEHLQKSTYRSGLEENADMGFFLEVNQGLRVLERTPEVYKEP